MTRDSASVSHSKTHLSFWKCWRWLAWLQQHTKQSHLFTSFKRQLSYHSCALGEEIRSKAVIVHIRRDSPHLVDEGNGLACPAVLLRGQLHVCFDDISRLCCQWGQDSRKDPTAKIQQGHEHWIQLVCKRTKGIHSDPKQARNIHAAWQSENLLND